MEYASELKKLKALVSDDTWECLKEHNAIIAGGAITSVFCNREVNDLDVYFRSEEDFIAFIEDVWGKGESRSSHFLIANNITDRSILFKDKETEQHVQVIVYKWFSSHEELFKDYDFTVNMGALYLRESYEALALHPDFLKHNAQRYLSFNEGTAYPLISALRVQKYVEKGYSISKAQMLRLLLAVNAKQIDSWDKLKDEIGGMYGLNMDEVFPKDKEFSLSTAIDTLSNLDYDEKYKMGAKPIIKEEVYAKILKGEKEDATNKIFKVVKKNADGSLVSHYNSKFEYVVGEVVNGGEHGLWFCNGYEVIGSQYYYHDNSHIVELEGGEQSKDRWGNGSVLKGDVKVVAAYSKMEFIKKYSYKQQEDCDD